MNIPNRKSKEVTERYGVERNTFKRTVKANKERKIDVEIGDAKQDDFKPGFKTKWFQNDYNRSIRAAEHPAAKVRTSGDKIIYKTPDYDVVQYELDAGEEGGHELEWLLKKKPKSNVLPFTLRYKGDVRFYFQPPLTDEEKKNGAHRPENVVNSYAVYIDKADHKVGGNNYATGKIEHIYRPKAIDSDGNEAWCELNIPEEGEAETNIECDVTVPQSFLDKASYPVVVDPTFGYSAIGGSTFTIPFSSGLRGISADSASEAGVIDKLTAYFSNSDEEYSTNAKAVITSSAKSILTNGVGDGTSVSFLNTGDWYDLPYTSKPTINASTEYYLCFITETATTADGRVNGDTFGGETYITDNNNYASPTDPTSANETSDRQLSIYATYTANSAPTVTTQAADNITTTSADGNGEITDTGGADASERGFVYDTVSRAEPTGSGTTLLDSESFETNFGDWSNAAGNDIDWSRDSGGTPSSSTGPSSGQDGSYYIYVETSGRSGSEVSIVEYDIGATEDGYVDFYFHQYGDDQGTLYLEGWDGSTWTTIWSSTGDQGNQWNNVGQASTEFSDYSKLRFRNVHDSGGSFRGDVALDNINVYEEDPVQSPAESDYSSVENETGTFSTGTFSLSLTGLTDNTTYYTRAYAENSEGYSYGDEVSFATDEDQSEVVIIPSSVTTQVGETVTFSASIYDENGDLVSTTSEWSSGDESVATVSSSGVTTGISQGSTLITITDTERDNSDSATITVNPSLPTVVTNAVTNIQET